MDYFDVCVTITTAAADISLIPLNVESLLLTLLLYYFQKIIKPPKKIIALQLYQKKGIDSTIYFRCYGPFSAAFSESYDAD